MSIENVPDTELSYYLIGYKADGSERTDDPDGLMSERVGDVVARQPVTDIFLISHGWKGDIPGARQDYNGWIRTAAQCRTDLELLRKKRAGFSSATVGLHWPSQPWGEEEFATGDVHFALDNSSSAQSLIDRYAERIADTPRARQALRTILQAARIQPTPPALPEEVRSAYTVLDQEAHLGSDGDGADPGADREPFDAEARYQAALEEAALPFGIRDTIGSLVLSPLRQLSFWKMKDRARRFGESGAHQLLQTLQEGRRDVRLHLMGHSFGCIVVSAAVGGPAGGPGLSRSVQSLVLVQGALSLWSYCSDIPYCRGRPGYFRGVADGKRVAGPIVTTQSRFDTAVGRWYPLGAGAARQIDLAVGELPRYGGVGTFGLRGPGLDLVDLDLQAADQPYPFQAGQIYNLESSQVIRAGGGASGAHSDISHPEVAHAVWSAALV